MIARHPRHEEASAAMVLSATFNDAPSKVPSWRSAPPGLTRQPRWNPNLATEIGTQRWFGDLIALIALIAGAIFTGSLSTHYSVYSHPEIAEVSAQEPSWSPPPASPVRAASSPPPRQREITMAAGENLSAMLRRGGADDEAAEEIDALVRSAIFPQQTMPGAKAILVFGHSSENAPSRLQSVIVRATLDAKVLLKQGNQAFSVRVEPIGIDATPQKISGRFHADPTRSAASAGAPTEIAKQFAQALKGIPEAGVSAHSANRFELVFASRRAADGLAQTGELLYVALFRGTLPVISLVHGPEGGRLQLVNSQYPSSPHSTPRWPVTGRFTSSFGMRFHPILGSSRMHSGVDISAPSGTPVYAIAAGTVTIAGWHGGHGKFVRLDHGAGLSTGYAHLSRFAVAPGEQVNVGQTIGYVGSTGLSTGPHLHFELYRDGRAVDPATVPIAGIQKADHAGRDKMIAAFAALKMMSE